jgi:uncharacterized protein YlxP (DUF503 family)
MYVGSLSVDLLLGDVHSLKEKRSIVRPIVAELTRRLPVAAGEVGEVDLHRRCLIGVAVVGADPARPRELLDAAERVIAAHPEVEVLSARRRLWNDEDE